MITYGNHKLEIISYLLRLDWYLVYSIPIKKKEASKGVWRMPRLSEATKDVVSCDKLRRGANNL